LDPNASQRLGGRSRWAEAVAYFQLEKERVNRLRVL
jgi:hypothetical protein